MKWSLLSLLLIVTVSAEAQIFRCDTPNGLVFSDTPCSGQAEVVDVVNGSSGISGGPSDEVKAELEQKKADRAEEREEARKLQASQVQQPVYVPTPVDQSVIYPGVWPWRPGVRPHPRPPRPRPKPVEPILPDSGNGTIRFPRH